VAPVKAFSFPDMQIYEKPCKYFPGSVYDATSLSTISPG
jgi:hypothetical protein